MADLSKEQFDTLPDFVRDDYEQSGDLYVPKLAGKVASLKDSLNSLDGKYKTTEQQLKQLTDSQKEAIEEAKRQALEGAKSKGDVSAVEKRYQEMLEDSQKRAGETLAERDIRIAKMADTIKGTKRNEILANARAKLKVFDDSKKAFDKLVSGMIDIDPETGKEIYLDENGSATSLDNAGFLAMLEKDQAFSRMREGVPPSTGGMANGSNSNGGGASRVMSRVDFEAMNPVQRAKFMKEGGKLKS